MVMVPSIEDIISKWCGGQSCAPPGPPQPNAPDPDFDDDMAPHIGAQFAQVRVVRGGGVRAALLVQCCVGCKGNVTWRSPWYSASAHARHPHGVTQAHNQTIRNTAIVCANVSQVVKELRTDYAEGVASCSNRMANHIRATPVTNIKTALNQPKPPADPHGGYQQVSTLTHQRDFVEAFMRPILAACDEALQVGRGAEQAAGAPIGGRKG